MPSAADVAKRVDAAVAASVARERRKLEEAARAAVEAQKAKQIEAKVIASLDAAAADEVEAEKLAAHAVAKKKQAKLAKQAAKEKRQHAEADENEGDILSPCAGVLIGIASTSPAKLARAASRPLATNTPYADRLARARLNNRSVGRLRRSAAAAPYGAL